MRGTADTADPALAQTIADRFDLGAVVGAMRSLARPDDMGRRWSVDTDRGRFTVRTMDNWLPIVDAGTDVALQQAAAAAGVLLPTPVRSRDGNIIESIGGHRWRAYQHLPAGPPLAGPVSSGGRPRGRRRARHAARPGVAGRPGQPVARQATRPGQLGWAGVHRDRPAGTLGRATGGGGTDAGGPGRHRS
ncbi:hypothetical protein ACN27F_05230 [Solwaraspora sp. WMMB335]|uniref:hypothetical protein n=1 Tax=Solwaraspora sp. WMMB335 TaxID=3404118 RepID=UPI003B95E0B2